MEISDAVVLLDRQKIRIKNKVFAWETLHHLGGWREPPAKRWALWVI